MSKKPPPTPITDNIIELKSLLVSRSIEKTDKYNDRIKTLKGLIDYFEYGVIQR